MKQFTLESFEAFLNTHSKFFEKEIEKNIPRAQYILEDAKMHFQDDADIAIMIAMGEIIESYTRTLAERVPEKLLKNHIGIQAADEASQGIRVLLSLRLAALRVEALEGLQ